MFDNLKRWNRNNRIKNMVWTVADNHSLSVDIGGAGSYTDTKKKVQISDVETLAKLGVKEEDAYDNSMYAAAHEGAHVKYTTAEALGDALKQGNAEGMDIDKLNALCQISEDYRIDHITTLDRPGYKDLRNGSMGTFVSLFGKERSGNDDFDTTKAISAWTYGIDMRDLHKSWEDLDWDKIQDVAETIIDNAVNAKSTKDVMDGALNLYRRHWMSEPPMPDGGMGEPEGEDGMDEGSPEDGEYEDSIDLPGTGDNPKSDKPEDKKDSDKGESEEEEGSGDGGDAEDADEDDGLDGKGGVGTDKKTSEKKELSDTELAEKMKDMMKSPFEGMMDDKSKEKLDDVKSDIARESSRERDLDYKLAEYKNYIKRDYPKCLWTKEEHEEIERKLCRGIHAGTALWYCEARGKFDETESKLKRLDGQARKLAERLREDMRAAKNAEGYISDNGSIIGSMAYKATKMDDNHIFFKSEYDEEGGYVIDLLLDASGSQGGRQYSIRDQAYIIGMACSLANIPCRITSFRVTLNTTIIERLRDFDSSIESNKNCFRFKANGDNRDGLAVQVIHEMLKKRHEPNKIFIFLSDGEPCDSSGEYLINGFGGLGDYVFSRTKWKGDGYTTGILDTAKSIRDVRRDGIPLMGIYVGSEHSLESEKLMFGNDFAYIGKDMKNFVNIVGNYLHKQIAKLG